MSAIVHSNQGAVYSKTHCSGVQPNHRHSIHQRKNFQKIEKPKVEIFPQSNAIFIQKIMGIKKRKGEREK